MSFVCFLENPACEIIFANILFDKQPTTPIKKRAVLLPGKIHIAKMPRRLEFFNISAVIEICRVFVYAGTMSASHANMILNLARSYGLLRTRDVDSAGAPRALLARLMHA